MEMPLYYGPEMEAWLQVSVREKKHAARKKLDQVRFWEKVKDSLFLFLWLLAFGVGGLAWAMYLGISLRALVVLFFAGGLCLAAIVVQIDKDWYARRRQPNKYAEVDLGVEQDFIIPYFDAALADYYSCAEGESQKKSTLKKRKDAIKRLGERHGLSFWDRDDEERDWAFSYLEWGQ